MSSTKYTTVPALIDETTNDGSVVMDFGELFSSNFLSTPITSSTVDCNSVVSPIECINSKSDVVVNIDKKKQSKRTPAKIKSCDKKKKLKPDIVADRNLTVDDMNNMSITKDNLHVNTESIATTDNTVEINRDNTMKIDTTIKDSNCKRKISNKSSDNENSSKRAKGKKRNEISWKKFIIDFYNNAAKLKTLGEGKTYKGTLSILQNIFALYISSALKYKMFNIFSEQFLNFLAVTDFCKYDIITFNISGEKINDMKNKNDTNHFIVLMDEDTLSLGNDIKFQEARRVFLENVIGTRIFNECITKLIPVIDIKYI